MGFYNWLQCRFGSILIHTSTMCYINGFCNLVTMLFWFSINTHIYYLLYKWGFIIGYNVVLVQY